MSQLNPAIGIYTCILPATADNLPLIGQMQYAAGNRSARVAFLMPEDGLAQPGLTEVLQNLAVQAGSWGAFHLLAEVEESNCALEGLRRSGFSVYAWQHIWKYTPSDAHPKGEKSDGKTVPITKEQPARQNGSTKTNGKHAPVKVSKSSGPCWQPAASVDEVMIRNLYQSLVPPLVQSAEPLPTRRLIGWVYRQENEILAYVEGIHGPQGIYLQPLIHPAVENVSEVMESLLAAQRNPLGRPIYIAIRSYQAWLSSAMRDLQCEVGPRQALMVKHLVVQQRVAVQVLRHSVLEKYTPEPSVPMVNNSTTVNK